MKRSIKIALWILIPICILASIGVGMTYYYIFSPATSVSTENTILIYPNEPIDSTYAHLKQKTLSPKVLKGLRLLTSYRKIEHFKPGHYILNGQSPARFVFIQLTRGYQTPIELTFTAKRDIHEAAKAIASQLMISTESVDSILQDTTALYWCLPNTYEVYWTITPSKLKARLQKEYDAFWTKRRKDLAKKQDLTPQEVTTLASIVQEESNNRKEQPIIAGLYMNRLRIGMPLQADPTIKYAVGDWTIRRVLNKHLAYDSPYNTYKHVGLPPSPIRMVSTQAIDAVLHAPKHPYLYMCAKEDFSGTHRFAKTLSEHNRNARLYRKALNRRKVYK